MMIYIDGGLKEVEVIQNYLTYMFYRSKMRKIHRMNMTLITVQSTSDVKFIQFPRICHIWVKS